MTSVASGPSASDGPVVSFGRSDRATIIVVACGSGRPEEADAGDHQDAGALRLSPDPCVAPAGGLGLEREAGI